MKRFKDKTSKFGSLISLIALSAMIAVFAANLPFFLQSTIGQVFAGFWMIFALVMFAAHTVRLSGERQRRAAIIPLLAGPKDARTRKSIHRMRAMRD
ncbi:hypothetical protein SRRS_28730 [Sporomusa rhizae]|uniref:hypothetical protein n=1 Tax=Sporomusa rhizae TaxID=357999 RepID=UPI00352A4108